MPDTARAAWDRETAAIDGLTARFIDVDGIRTRYYEAGTGDPLILWHGAGPDPTASANAWTLNVPGLAGRFRVLAADKLMTGMTGNPAREADYTIDAQIAHAWAFQRAVGAAGGAHLVGHARGAYVATRIALEHPNAVRTLVISDSSTLAPDVGDVSGRRKSLFGGPLDPAIRLRTAWERLSNGATSHISEALAAAGAYMATLPKGRETERVARAGGLARYEESVARQKPETLRRLADGELRDIPVLVYWAADDPVALLEQGVELFRAIARTNERTRMVVTAGVGHFHFRQRPDEFNANVIGFVERFGA